ncbi:hypothetical protein [Arthrobacter alpinus]|uniref:hypothetical protein n=1 Tax=Arthrobacter alpinus TaxID=656366 RepID=UPI003B5877D9
MEVAPDATAHEVDVPGVPSDAADAARRHRGDREACHLDGWACSRRAGCWPAGAAPGRRNTALRRLAPRRRRSVLRNSWTATKEAGSHRDSQRNQRIPI